VAASWTFNLISDVCPSLWPKLQLIGTAHANLPD